MRSRPHITLSWQSVLLGIQYDIITLRGWKEHTINLWEGIPPVLDQELLAFKVLLHDEPALRQLPKNHIVRTLVYVLIHKLAALVAEADTLAAAREVAAYPSVGVCAHTCALHQVREDVDEIFELIQAGIVLLIVFNFRQYVCVNHVILK